MILDHTRNIETVNNKIRVKSKIESIRGENFVNLPDLHDGWSAFCLFSFGRDSFCLKLTSISNETAYWFLDNNYNLFENVIENFVRTRAVFDWKFDQVVSDSGDEFCLEDIYELTRQFTEATSCDINKNNIKIISDSCDDNYKNAVIILNELNTNSLEKFSIFDKSITRSLIDAKHLVASSTLGKELKFDIFIPLSNFWYVGFSSDATSSLCILITGHTKIAVSIFNMNSNNVYSSVNLASNSINEKVLLQIKLWASYLKPMLSKAVLISDKIGIVLRENHIGHYIWNELTVIEYLISRKFELSIFAYPESDEPVFKVEEIFPELKGYVTRNIADPLVHMQAVVCQGVSFLPYAEFHITENLASRLKNIAINKSRELNEALKIKGHDATLILIGLRLENRCWIRQEEGYKALIKKLSEFTNKKFVIIFDGHNYSSNSEGGFVKSYREWEMPTEDGYPEIVKKEIDLVSSVIEYANQMNYINIEIHNLVPCTISSSIVASLNSSFFVTHWGAGLAKYKWVANMDGCIISSSKVLIGKGDLRIYDSTEFRENAIPCIYIDPINVTEIDRMHQSSGIFWEGSDRDNFDLDPEYFSEFVCSSFNIK